MIPSHRAPAQVWRAHTAASSGDELADLAAVIRRYARIPGARLMTRGQVIAAQHLTPLERALPPASQKPCGPAASVPEEAHMGKRTYDESDPNNAPLSPEEERLLRIQDQGMRERQADQERAGKRFDLLEGSEWGTDHGNL